MVFHTDIVWLQLHHPKPFVKKALVVEKYSFIVTFLYTVSTYIVLSMVLNWKPEEFSVFYIKINYFLRFKDQNSICFL